jgi:membrane dipeptidase
MANATLSQAETILRHRRFVIAVLLFGAGPTFAAALPVDRATLKLHQRLLTLDTHLDTPASFARPGWDFGARHSLESDFSQVDLPRMAMGGLDGGFFVIYTPQGPRTPEGLVAARDAAWYRAVQIRETIARLSSRAELAFTAADAPRIAAAGRAIVYQSMENAYPLTTDISLLQSFHKLGLRMVGIAHFLNNDFGDSSTDPKGPEWNGLSPLGHKLVSEANRLGIIVDASHSSDAVLDQVLVQSKAPIILSHSGCKAVYDHPRNVDDARLKALAAKGGVIQINAYGGYLAPEVPNPERDAALKALGQKYGNPGLLPPERVATLVKERRAILDRYPGSERSFDQFLAHLLHALQLVGPDHVGIGADWDGGGGVIGMQDVTGLPQITAALLKAGYTEADLQKIWGGNVLRLMTAVEAAAAKPSAG